MPDSVPSIDRPHSLSDVPETVFESQASLRATFEHLPTGVVVWTPDGNVVMANRAFCQMLGRDHAELAGMSVDALTHPDDHRVTADVIAALRDGSASLTLEKRYLCADGAAIWVRNAVSAVRDERGAMRFIVAVSTDITRQKETERHLRDAEERARLALSAAAAGSWMWHAHDGRIDWDARQFALFGADPSSFEPTYDGFLARIHPDDQVRVDEQLTVAREEKRGFQVEFRVPGPNGAPRWIEAWGDVVLGADGEVERMIGLNQDVTGRKTEELKRELVDNVTSAINTSLDYDETLRAVTRCAVPAFADFSAVYIRDADSYRRLAYHFAHQDRHELTEHRLNGQSVHGIGRVFATGEPELFEQIGDEALRDIATSDEHLDVLRSVGFVSGIVVPMRSRGVIIGAMSFSTAESQRRFGPADLQIASEIARRASVALENARIHAEIQQTLALKQASDERFRLASEASHLGTWEWDLREKVVWSDSLERIYGFAPGMFPGTMDAFAACIHPDDLDYVMGCVSAAMDAGADLDMEHRIVRQTGETRWMHGRGRLIRDASGAPAHMVGIGLDITEQKLADQREALTQERYRALAESMPAIVSTATAGGDVDYFNQQWYAYTGYSEKQSADPQQRPLVFHPDDRENVMAHWQQAMRDGASYSIEYRLLRHDGEYRWHLGHVAPLVTGEAVANWVSTSIDIHDRKLAEAQREELLTELRHANAAKDEFLGLVSHELKTPITTIYGNAEVLTRRGDAIDEEGRAQALSDIRLEADRLHRIVDNLLILARLEQGRDIETEPVLLERIVRRLIDDHKRQYPRREIALTQHDADAPVIASPIYLEQVLRNLISNAEKYSAAGTPIEIRIEEDSEEARVLVLDRGAGIAASEEESIFAPFYRSERTAATAQGVGVGLAVCRRLIEAQNGRVWVRARDGGGSEFGIGLPLPGDAQYDA